MLRLDKRSVLYNAGVMALSGACFQTIGFIYRVYLSRAAGAEALGLYRLIMPIHSLSLALSIAGARMAMTALSAEMQLPADRERVRLLTRLCLGLFLIGFLLLAVPILLFAPKIATGFLGDTRTAPALPVMMVCVFLTGFELVLESVFLGLKQTKYTAISNLLEQVTVMGTVIALLTLLRPGDVGETARLIVVGMVVSEVPVVVWLMLAYRKIVLRCPGASPPPRAGPTRADVKALTRRILKIALPVTAGGAITTLLASSGTVLLPRRLVAAGLTETRALEQLGIITGMALPLMSIPMLFLAALSTVLLPTVSASHAAGREANTRRKVRKAVQAVSLIALPVTAILLPLAPELAELLYGQTLSTRYLALLAVAVVLVDYQIVTMAILNGLGLQAKAIRNVIVGEATELVLVYFLAAQPSLHIYGYILGMIVCAGLITALNLRLIVRATGARLGLWKCVGLPALIALIVGLMTNAAYTALCVRLDPVSALFPTFAIAAAVAAAMYLLIGIRPIRYLRGVLRRKV